MRNTSVIKSYQCDATKNLPRLRVGQRHGGNQRLVSSGDYDTQHLENSRVHATNLTGDAGATPWPNRN